jgi:hypothetical protein
LIARRVLLQQGIAPQVQQHSEIARRAFLHFPLALQEMLQRGLVLLVVLFSL